MNQNIEFEAVRITGGFWKQKQELIRNVTIKSVYEQFLLSGRIDAFTCSPELKEKLHIFWDSDVAKWIESVAYLSELKKEPELEALADVIIENLAKNQMDDGYFNTYFQVCDPEHRFTFRRSHELYCAGHLIEAGIAYKKATGKDLLYRCMLKYVELIDRVFRVEKSAKFLTPGHQEIELALLRLYRCSKDEKHLRLAEYFINARGSLTEWEETEPRKADCDPCYSQDHLPPRAQTEAKGHAVRLLYYCSAMADLALEQKDKQLLCACERIFEDIVSKKIYITGGIGASSNCEGFDPPYDLPNQSAYNETCASIAMCLFASRMQLLSDSSAYADVIENEIYNGVLSGISLGGDAFYYENPLEICHAARERLNNGCKQTLYFPITQREKVFSCSCCPPNLTRFIPSLGGLIYTQRDSCLRVQQYIQSVARLDGAKIEQKTDYPRRGGVRITYSGKSQRVGFRIPAWCKKYTCRKNRKAVTEIPKDGYLYLDLNDGDTVELNFGMKPLYAEAYPDVWEDAGRVAVMRGPVVYCAEQRDNEGIRLKDFRLSNRIRAEKEFEEFGCPVLYAEGTGRAATPDGTLYGIRKYGKIPQSIKLIPYFANTNRGKTDMVVWLLEPFIK